MRELTVKTLYERSLDDEAMWTKQAIENEPGTWEFNFAIRKLAIQRVLQVFLKQIPMDKVLHDGRGYTKEYATYLEIVNG